MLMPLRPSLLARILPERLCPVLAGLLIVAAAALHLIFHLHASTLDLAPDEAHYWDWSRHLDWSYYSKGPLVAWIIRGSCELFGAWSEQNTGSLTFAVRLPATLFGSLLLVSLYLLTVLVFGRPRLALAVVASALTLPLIAAGSSLMTIDSPYTCCWGWALVFAHRAVFGRRAWAWAATGIAVGLGLLAKYTMVLFPFSLALFLLASRDHRRLLFAPGFWCMAGITLMFCVPILVWNAQNDWVTFLHVQRLAGLAPGEIQASEGRGIDWAGPGLYLAGQAALLLGYWFVAWAAAMIAYRPGRHNDPGILYLWWLSAPMFLVFLAFSVKTAGGELNWPVTAYLSGGVLAAAWLADQLQSPRRWYRRATAALVGLFLLLGLSVSLASHKSELLHPLLARLTGPPTVDRPFPLRRLDPTCRLRGWHYLAARVDEVRNDLRARGFDPVLAGVHWTIPGELGVYCADHPQAYSIGLLQGDRHSQYDHWTNPIDHPEPFLGRTFLVIGLMKPELKAAFERVEPVRRIIYEVNGRPLTGWTITVCHGFRGFPEMAVARPH